MTSCNFLYYLCKKFAFLARCANLLCSNLCNFKIQSFYLEICAFEYIKFLSPFNHSPELYKLWLSPRNTLVPGVQGLLSDRQRKYLICFSKEICIVWNCFAAISSINDIFPVYSQIKSCLLWFSARIWKANTEVLISTKLVSTKFTCGCLCA